MKKLRKNQKEETHQRSCDVVGSGRARCSAVGLATLDAPPDRVGDPDGLDPAISGELESTGMGRIDPHRDTRTGILYEELARRVRVNPQVAALVVDRELIAPELALRRCRCGLCHAAPPSWLVGFRSHPVGVRVLAGDIDDGLPEALATPLLLGLDDGLQEPSFEAVERLELALLGDTLVEHRDVTGETDRRVVRPLEERSELSGDPEQEQKRIADCHRHHGFATSSLVEMCCNQATMARLFCYYKCSISDLVSQAQQKISISAALWSKSYEFND